MCIGEMCKKENRAGNHVKKYVKEHTKKDAKHPFFVVTIVTIRNILKCIMYIAVFSHVSDGILELCLSADSDFACQIHVFDEYFFHS